MKQTGSMVLKRGLACVGALVGMWSAGLGAEEVGVLGPEGWAYETIFKQAGVPAIGIRLGDDLAGRKIIVVTPNAVRDGRASFAEHADRLKQYVQAGGFLLVLHQNDKGWDDRWLPYSCRNSNGAGQIEKIVQKDHPVFQGFEERDLGSPGIGVHDTFTDVAPEWKVLCTDHYPDGKKPSRIAIMECTYGKGRVLVSCYNSEISPDEIEDSDMQKVRLLFNQLSYALARQGISAEPDLSPLQKMAAATPVLAPAVKMESSTFFSMVIGHGKEMSAGAAVLPTGRLGTLLYHGAVYESTRRNEDKYLRQRYHLFREGFVIHWSAGGEQQGKKRSPYMNSHVSRLSP